MSVFFELRGNLNMSRDLKNEERLFGTDGIRGTVNKGKITALMAVKLAMAAGDYFFGRAGTKKTSCFNW
jgi:phosphomannomutase